MSNDTSLQLTFKCPTTEELNHVLWYLDFKKSRWDHWEKSKGSKGLKARVGTRSAAAIVSWGFSIEEPPSVNEHGTAIAKLTAWANQNTRNVWITGDRGELADLRKRFPFLTIEGTYSDEYGSGDIEY